MGSTKVIEGDNLSIAWARAFLAATNSSHGSLRNVMVGFPVYGHGDDIFGNESNEDSKIRTLLNQTLDSLDSSSVDTVASTIFPISLWNSDGSRDCLFNRFKAIWPRVKRCRGNYNGTYFQRMIAWGWEIDKQEELSGKNQLEHVIETYVEKNNARRSALFAAITNPLVDHTHQKQKGFPCLQHVHFVPHSQSPAMTITGIYSTQLMLEKAYGNYLGLYRLGQFMAQEMGLKLTRVECNTSRINLSKTSKGYLQDLKSAIEWSVA